MKTNLETLLSMKKEELLEELKNTYQKQKLSRIQGYIARGLEIFVALIVIFSGIGIFYSILYTLTVIYSIYRFLNPHGEDKDYYKKFELLVEGFENFKRYKNSEISVEFSEKKINGLEKNIVKFLPKLIAKNGVDKMSKIFAFIPIINLRIDEMSMYREANGYLNILLNGKLGSIGLSDFSDENLKLQK